MSRQMKDSGIEWIGEYPDCFENKKIKYLIERRYGGCWGNDPVDGENNLCIRIADFDFETQTVKSSASTLRKYSKTQLSNGLLKDGDIIIEKSGGGEKTPVGRSVLYSEKSFPNAMFANFCDAIRPKSDVYNKFLAYCLKAFYQNYDMHLFFNQTTGLQNLNMSAYLDSRMPVPTFCEQKMIANFLDSKCSEIDSLTKDIEHQIEVLEEYKKSVITEAVTKGLDPDVPMKDSGIEWVGKIPEGWIVDKIKYHLRRNETKNHSNAKVLSVYREYGVIPKDSRDDNHNVTSEDTSKYKFVRVGSLVINKMKAWQGSLAVSDYEGIVSPAYFIYEFFDKSFNKRYFHYLIRSCYKDEFRRISGGIREGQWDLPSDLFENELVLIPSVTEQNEIVEYIESSVKNIESIIADKKKQLETLAEYKKSLIYEYVTGKKEVIA